MFKVQNQSPDIRLNHSRFQPYWQSITYNLRSNLSHFSVQNGPFHRVKWVRLYGKMAEIETQ